MFAGSERWTSPQHLQSRVTLCDAIVLPGRKSGFRVEFRPDRNRESPKIGPPAGGRADVEAFPIRIGRRFGPEARFPARKILESTVPTVKMTGELNEP